MNCSRSPLWCVYRRAKVRGELVQSCNSKISFRRCLKHSDLGITSHRCTATVSSACSRGTATHTVTRLLQDTTRVRIGVFGMRHGAISSVLKASLTNSTTCLKTRVSEIISSISSRMRLSVWHHSSEIISGDTGAPTVVKGIQGKYELASGRVE